MSTRKITATGRLGLIVFLLMIFSNPIILKATIYGKITGHIVADDTGKPLLGCEVWLYDLSWNQSPIMKKLADNNGKASFEGLKEGKYKLLFAPDQSTGYFADAGQTSYDKAQIIVLEKGKHVEVHRRAFLGGTLIIRFKKRDGTRTDISPDTSIKYYVSGKIYRGPLEITYEPDAAGDYVTKGMPLDEYSVALEIDGYAEQTNVIKIEKGKTTEQDFIVDFDDPTGVEGKVISAIDGGPISWAQIRIRSDNPDKTHIGSTYSDKDGNFSVVGMSPGAFTVFCISPLGVKPGSGDRKQACVVQGKRTQIELKLNMPSNIKRPLQNTARGTSFFLSTEDEKDGDTSLPKRYGGLFLCGSSKPLTENGGDIVNKRFFQIHQPFFIVRFVMLFDSLKIRGFDFWVDQRKSR